MIELNIILIKKKLIKIIDELKKNIINTNLFIVF
jgi:hypothetical protein